jgi:hypothetical protein
MAFGIRKYNPVFCALALLISILLIRPFVNIGLCDDFSYVRTAKLLAETGHLNYFGWATPMLGWQLLLGALFIKIFGFSFASARSAVFMVALASSILLQRTFVRCGLSERNATVATLILMISPLYLPLSFSFMSDVCGLFSFILCLYCCVRAIQAPISRSAFNWLITATASNLVTGTVRQIAWLGVLVLVPSTFLLLRRWRPRWIIAITIWLFCVGFIFAVMHWFQHQPFSQQEKLIRHRIDSENIYNLKLQMVKFTLGLCLYLLPVSVAYLYSFALRKPRYLGIVLTFVTIVGLGINVALHHSHRPAVIDMLAPFDGDFVNPDGAVEVPVLGSRPVVLGVGLRFTLTLLTVAATTSFFCFLYETFFSRGSVRFSKDATVPESTTLSLSQLAILFGPFAVAYYCLLIPRGLFAGIVDRYMLPMLVIGLIITIRLYQERVADHLPAVTIAALGVFAAYGIASTHDRFQMQRAQLAAVQELLDAHIPRNQFYGGFEYDGWTQIDEWGYVDNDRINFPPGFVPRHREATSYPCDFVPGRFYPAIHPRFGSSFSPRICDGPSDFKPVVYHNWLSPQEVTLYIVKIAKPGPLDFPTASRTNTP